MVTCASIKQNDWAITWILSFLEKQKQHASVIGSTTKLNMGNDWCYFTYMHTMEYDSGSCLFLWSGMSNPIATASAFMLEKR